MNKTASTRPAPSEEIGGDTLFRALVPNHCVRFLQKAPDYLSCTRSEFTSFHLKERLLKLVSVALVVSFEPALTNGKPLTR